jgi:hypothetical protein
MNLVLQHVLHVLWVVATLDEVVASCAQAARPVAARNAPSLTPSLIRGTLVRHRPTVLGERAQNLGSRIDDEACRDIRKQVRESSVDDGGRQSVADVGAPSHPRLRARHPWLFQPAKIVAEVAEVNAVELVD